MAEPARDGASLDGGQRVPRVLHLLTRDGYGGTEVQVMNLVLRTHPDRCQQTVVVLRPWFPGVGARLDRAGVPVGSLAGHAGLLAKGFGLGRILRQGSFDAVEAYGFKAGLIARIGALFARVPFVIIGVRGIHFTEGETNDRKARLAQFVERTLAHTVYRYAANSEGARRFLTERGFPDDKFVVTPNGVDLDVPMASGDHDGPVRIVCVARLVVRKRHSVLLEALAELRARGHDVSCELIGAGPAFEDLRARTRDLGLAEIVTFSGSLPPTEVRQRLAASDIFVLVSAWEGMPGSLMEAMAARLPVVATAVNGTTELVVDSETGYLVPVDDVDSVVSALDRLVADRDLRGRIGAAGRRRITDFSFDRCAERKVAFYRGMVREGS